ncbi:MAG: proline--tRNA ligase [Flavobacteriales bacterium TMED96]|nr:MAG: proline--tRNA ligase [Flavobacteriales bacterium TMED96]
MLTKRSDNFSKWYNELVSKAQLAENSSVRGCMVIKPYGFSIWESMKNELDKKFKATGHQNAYFPLFVPKSLFEAEEKNAEGFAKECAVVTHYRLKNSGKDGKLIVDPEAKLEEELIVRPTSEAIIWRTYKNWIQSYRDLPLLINQWANVVRWEMRPRLFLRTAEFLWQEGHTAHSTKKEAEDEALLINDLYADFVENYMAIPVIKGLKSESERFAGAVETHCIEALMQDGKALQAGTSHFLGDNFAKAFNVKFANQNGNLEYVWATSWGVSTRLMGALIMTHSDDKGLVLPPNLAPTQVVIVPIFKGKEQLEEISIVAKKIKDELESKNVRVQFDNRENLKPGFKFAEHEMKGIPIRVAIGPKDIEKDQLELARRDTEEKIFIKQSFVLNEVEKILKEIHVNLFERAKKFLEENITEVDNYDDFKNVINQKGGFVYAYWDGTTETEEKIKKETKATIRCIPYSSSSKGKCVLTGKKSSQKVYFAKSY